MAGAGVVVAVALGSSDDPVRAEAASTAAAAPLSGLPLVALPPVADASTDDRLASLEAIATEDPARADVQMAIGSEQLVRGDAVAASAAFNAAKKLGEPAADTALVVASYNAKSPDATISRLELLAPSSPFARYELGVVQLWAGRLPQATAALRAVRDGAPESFYGVKADDLLHPTMQPGYPLFVPAEDPPKGATLGSLKVAADQAPNDAQAQLQYGAALQGAGRRLEAVKVYTQALRADPTSIESQVALVLAGFQKDDPAKAFGTVGPLVRDRKTDPSPRFHLAMMLLWIGQPEKAQAEFRQVASEAPGTRLARLAEFFAPK